MTSRRKAANPGNSSPAVRRYELRDRTKNVVQYSSAGRNTTAERDPQTPEPGGHGDISQFVRPVIKDPDTGKERKGRAAEQNVKSKSTRTVTKPVEPDLDDDSSGSDYSNSSRLSENDEQSHFPPTSSSSKSFTVRQPSPPRQLEKHTYAADDTTSSLFRAPIRTSVDDKDKPKYYIEETWRGSTKTRQFQSGSEGVEKETIQYQEKTKGQLNETTHYKEEREIRSRINRREEPILYQTPPKETTKAQLARSRAHFAFSDDDEEERTSFPLPQRATQKVFPSSLAEGDRIINHYPEKKLEQKVNIRKPPTRSFLHGAGTCIKYLILVLVPLIVASGAVLYLSPESVHNLVGQITFADKPQVKKDLKDDFEKLSSVFTDQSPLMWNRSRRILERHLENWKANTEPAIILLAGAQDAEQTLLCLGTQLADIYSSSLSGNYTVISGSDWVSGSNEQVKEYIDHRLSEGFQATTQAAVLHRLEQLPAGSLLILYKYCDHESAVFKDVMLLLTVLLDDPTLPKDIPPLDLEEKVRAFLIQKLIETNAKASHDGMDRDKFSGVWSRISHIVLPVYPEKESLEQCKNQMKA
ncbi:torsin-1A-interacting protein 1-like isoform X2 [Eleutherodactylus coqui]|uniref:torsin-1A-interacting protein 1-like isoform X2 n=1 Tax=Eleutherodactylus coqui TaxID=57060 RepID=UPI0034631D90